MVVATCKVQVQGLRGVKLNIYRYKVRVRLKVAGRRTGDIKNNECIALRFTRMTNKVASKMY